MSDPFATSDANALNAYEKAIKAKSLDSTCEQCGLEIDLLTAFTKNKVCGVCSRKNHKNT